MTGRFSIHKSTNKDYWLKYKISLILTHSLL